MDQIIQLAETVNGLYKTEVIEYLKADWQGLADVQLATEPYRVCRRPTFLRECPNDKTKIYP